MTGRSSLLAATTGAIRELRAVSLAEVLDEAALQVRIDRKYLVPINAFIEMTDRLRHRFAVLDIDGRRSFKYESVYFDSADYRLYREHVQRRRRRYKVRTRAYLDSGECTFEVKLKGGRSETVKARMPYGLDDRARLTGEALEFLGDQLRTEYGVSEAGDLVPALTTTYRRTTLVDRGDHARLTCDIDLLFHHGPSGGGDVEVVRGPVGAVLVESKTAGRAGVADRVLRDLGIRPIQVSKYCVAAALLNPGLRANPWHRTLRQLQAA
ncbi:VTC domain-containing protein [Kribbella sp. NBC_01245]|uniref:VTC domain-containing protein n=1 Tax=Kribbella sp. NBC_01245 TaxID=2903578 RepID=UPI002E2A20D6|nr:VTC domain-containing protein [Kribbella sp. NBC_01245]